MIYSFINCRRLLNAFDLSNFKDRHVIWYNIRGYNNVGEEYLDSVYPQDKFTHLHTTYGILKAILGEDQFNNWWSKSNDLEMHVVAIFKK